MINRIRFWLIRKLAGDNAVAMNFKIIDGGIYVDATKFGLISNVHISGAVGPGIHFNTGKE